MERNAFPQMPKEIYLSKFPKKHLKRGILEETPGDRPRSFKTEVLYIPHQTGNAF